MITLTEKQVQEIKSHMLHEEDALRIKFKGKNTTLETISVPHNEVEDYEKRGYIIGTSTARRTKMNKPKPHGLQLEDDIWCMFYKLGFRKLNADEHLAVQWGPNSTDTQQLDVVAVGEEAIFVVECKAANQPKTANFKDQLNKIEQYKAGVTDALQQIYGHDKKVKFIFATRNYRIADDSEDKKRMENMEIFHLNDNSYNYINNLIKSYKESVIYQFYALMFKDELISDDRLKIPVLRGQMGGHSYYIFSIEPSTLLKIGFVLHRTRVNDSMAPTYQRLLVPSRLKGITKFIDGGGYFPNSIIINFASNKDKDLNIEFSPIKASQLDSNSEFGFLYIPNAYGIAYIIDGQHRVYGYAQSNYKDLNQIPVVAFENMASEEQLKIFMEINENQKSVSPSLRLDLEEDLYWSSPRLDSRMKALRSSIIKHLSGDSNYILYNMISVGEDNAKLAFKPFSTALSHSGLLPKATNSQWTADMDTCIYDTHNMDISRAMVNARKEIVAFIDKCYTVAKKYMKEDVADTFLFSNRATYAFITFIGSLHKHLVLTNQIQQHAPNSEKIDVISKYIITLSEKLNNLSDEDNRKITGVLGQGADTFWLRSYQNLVSKVHSDYQPEELIEWRETQDQSIQDAGKKMKEEILSLVSKLLVSSLRKVYGDIWERNVRTIKNQVETRIIETYGDEKGWDILDNGEWTDYLDVAECRGIISDNFSNEIFQERFAIQTEDNAFKTKKEKLNWMTYIVVQSGKKAIPLTQSDLNRLELISSHLSQFEEE